MVPLAVLCGVMMAFLAGVGLSGQIGPPTPQQHSCSCHLYDAEQKAAAGSNEARAGATSSGGQPQQHRTASNNEVPRC